MLLGVRPVKPRKRLYRLDPRQSSMYMNRVQQRLIISRLKLVRADQQTDASS
jgi:hypothetical protein